MLEKIMDAGIGIYILWGIGFLGLLMKIITDTYVKSLIRASENMATTRKKHLSIIRRKYENGRSLGINNGSGQAFAEKSVRSLRLGLLPLEAWRRCGYSLCCVVLMVCAAIFWYEDVGWRSSPEMEGLLANGFLVCAFLLCLENIFVINNKLEILKANIRDYLENLSPVRCRERREATPQLIVGEKEEPKGIIMPELATTTTEEEKSPGGKEEGETGPKKRAYNQRDGNSDMLDSFLKEFFT